MKNEVKIFAMDVDGTLTDGKIYIGESGEVCKAFDIKDGLGIKQLQANGIVPVIITGRESRIVLNRARELDIIEIYQNIADKREILDRVVEKYQVTLENVAYIGDDINDLPIIEVVGTSYAPSNAVPAVRAKVDYVVTAKGGEGAVREAVDMILGGKE